jgi:high affinity Mn2+ porin
MICAAFPAAGQDAADDGSRWSYHFQATSIGQAHGAFDSLYVGNNSLPPYSERRVSLTATAFLAFRLSSHFEFVVDPEIAGGKGFGQVTGIAGFTNGEIPRVAGATPTLYVARAFVHATWSLNGETTAQENAPNQIAERIPVERFSVVAGRFAVTDYFDNNTYSHDPRRQFMNWALMSNGAWDYPADVRGYTVGTVQELTMKRWSLRAATVL